MHHPLVLAAALVACGAAYAHGRSAPAVEGMRPAGTLTCVTRPELTLVFGRTPVAGCAFVPSDGSLGHAYLAMFDRLPAHLPMPGAETTRWEVSTPDGRLPLGALTGAFAADTTAGQAWMTGQGGDLRLLSHSARRTATFLLANRSMALAAAEQGR